MNFILTENKAISFDEFERLTCNLASFLQTQGVKKGDRFPFPAINEWETIILFFALWRLGAIACPVRPPGEMPPLEFEKKSNFIPDSIDEHLPATLIYTSGSSGLPKLACHTFAQFRRNAQSVNHVLGFTSQHSWLLSLPLHHVGGISIMFRCYLARATLVLPPLKTATHLSYVPTQLYRALGNPIDSHILLGGAPIADSLIQKAQNQGFRISTSYGLTEMSSTVAINGKVLPGIELKLAPDGEILARGDALFLGYDTDGKLSLPLTADGWFATKDLGQWTPDGLLHVTSRKDNLFISGGENIQPEEIEAALTSLPGITHAFVVPIPDPEFGMRPAAFLHPNPYTLAQVRTLLETKLPRFKHPIQLLPLPEEHHHSKPPRALLKTLAQNPDMSIFS